MEALNHQDVGCLDGFSGVQDSRHMVVNGLVHRLSLSQGLDLIVHEVKVLGLGCKGGHTCILATVAIQ
eukprot:scaffold649_cov347-Pavlova_lutheri.AAC.92